MHIQTHILSGWCAASLVRLTARERAFCMVAAAIPDLDGLGILWSQEAYWDYHHLLGHNLAFAVVTAGVLGIWSTHRAKAIAMYLVCFHLHLVMDFWGSGPGWPMHYWWPFSRVGYAAEHPWDLSSWQNKVAFFALLAWTVGIACRQKRTPLETITPGLDRQLVGLPREVNGFPVLAPGQRQNGETAGTAGSTEQSPRR